MSVPGSATFPACGAAGVLTVVVASDAALDPGTTDRVPNLVVSCHASRRRSDRG